MDTHVRTLGTLNILFGAASALLGVMAFILFGGPIGLYSSFSDNILGVLLAGSACFHLFLAFPCIIGGIYLRSFTEWARGLLIVTSALNILNPPAGCLLGSYGLWVLLTPESDPLFSQPPPDYRPKKPAQAASAASNGKAAAKPQKPAATSQKPAAPSIVPSPRS